MLSCSRARPQDGIEGSASNRMFAILFFCIYIFLCSFTMLTILTSLLADAYVTVTETESKSELYFNWEAHPGDHKGMFFGFLAKLRRNIKGNLVSCTSHSSWLVCPMHRECD